MSMKDDEGASSCRAATASNRFFLIPKMQPRREIMRDNAPENWSSRHASDMWNVQTSSI